MKLTLEDKLQNVKLHVDEGVPLFEIQRTKGQNVRSLKYCVALYKKWGEKAFQQNGERRQYSRKRKLKVIKESFENKRPFRQIAIDLMLTDPRIVSDWVKIYEEKGEDAINDTCFREANN